jgi:hypothetical protein
MAEPGRRRQARAEGGRSRRYVVKVTPDEEAQLEGRASELNVSVSRYLIELALAKPDEGLGAMPRSEREEVVKALFGIQRLAANVANNINQIARWANTNSSFPADAELTLHAYRELALTVDDALTRIAGDPEWRRRRRHLERALRLDEQWQQKFPEAWKEITNGSEH